jgi:hypothetical protein
MESSRLAHASETFVECVRGSSRESAALAINDAHPLKKPKSNCYASAPSEALQEIELSIVQPGFPCRQN